VDDIAGSLLALRQIVFLVWVILTEHKWVTLAERRGIGFHQPVANNLRRTFGGLCAHAAPEFLRGDTCSKSDGGSDLQFVEGSNRLPVQNALYLSFIIFDI
jgi:hypothetical protein